MTKPTHLVDLLAERKYLATRLAKLRSFMFNKDAMSKLEPRDANLLREQYFAMLKYRKILQLRVNAASVAEPS